MLKPKRNPTNEKVPFRLIRTPCCSTLLCWVNPRLPSFCPECGKGIYPAVKSCVTIQDDEATLRVDGIRTPEPDDTPYMKLVMLTKRLWNAAMRADIDGTAITVTLPEDYWHRRLMPSSLKEAGLDIYHRETRMDEFTMHGIKVVMQPRPERNRG